VLVSWSHAGRLRSESAFAALAPPTHPRLRAGDPLRLNRGGDRQLNRALHTILLVCLRTDPDTRAYMARRTAEGKSRRDAKRCLRRVIARQLFRLLERYDRPGVEILRAA
jgi:transposase